jgi:hypothetical protein
MVGVAGSEPALPPALSAFCEGAIAMTCTSVRVVAGSASVLFTVLTMLRHDGILRAVLSELVASVNDLLDCLAGLYTLCLDIVAGIGCAQNGSVTSSKSTVLARRKVLFSEERASNLGHPWGGGVTLFAFFFRQVLSGTS